jgi:ethanolamine utilization protein EutQ (cupin superfamily)
MSLERFSISDVKHWQRVRNAHSGEIFVGDVVDEERSNSMAAGFCRYDAGASNTLTVSFDEALVIVDGRLTITTAEGERSAGPGEILWLDAWTKVTYSAEEETTIIFFTFPIWQQTAYSRKTAEQVLEPAAELALGVRPSAEHAS